MVDFVKPSLLGKLDEFKNRFEAPIVAGGQANATVGARKQAKYRSHVLRNQLKPFVLRKDVSVISNMLPSKYEITIKCKLSPLQEKLYQKYLEYREESGIRGNADLLSAKNTLCLLGNHPKIPKNAAVDKKKKKKKANIEDDVDDDTVDSKWIETCIAEEEKCKNVK
jgi:DNA repair and recombination RAD54-like protein